MSEQRRMMLAVLLSGLIVVGWQFIAMKFAPEVPPQNTTQAAPALTGNAPDATRHPPAAASVNPAAAHGTATIPVISVEQENGISTTLIALAPVQQRQFATGVLQGAISNEGPSLSALALLEYNEHTEENEAKEGDTSSNAAPDTAHDKNAKHPVSLANAPKGENVAVRQAEVIWLVGTERIRSTLAVQQQGSVFRFVGEIKPGVHAQATITPRARGYGLDYALQLTNSTGASLALGAGIVMRLHGEPHDGGFLAPPADLLQGLCSVHDVGVERVQGDTLHKDGAFKQEGAIAWAGIDRQYFVAAAIPKIPASTGACVMHAQQNVVTVDYALGQASIASGATWQQDVTVYMGPKRAEALSAVAPQLNEVIDYAIWGIPLGFLARPMVYLLNIFHQWTASWGVAIMLLTLVVKLLLFPVTYKSVVSMRRMQLLKPEMDKLRERFKDDRERQQMEQLKLFREKGVNPLGGCLPMLLQMPVWFALYRTLWTSVDLYQQPFLWLSDLTRAEAFPILALLLGVVTFVQQKLTPNTMDSQQAKMMLYMMPVMLTVFMIALPSGLVLYILVNSILTIVQQLAINRREVTL